MGLKEKFFSEALLKETAKKKLGLVIKDGAVTADKIADDSISTEKIIDKAISTDKLADGSVTNIKIADNAVSTDKILNYSITTDKLKDGSVTTPKIADGNVTADKLADKSITTIKIDDEAVSTGNIADSAITTEKLYDGAVTTSKIEEGAITLEKLAEESLSAKNHSFVSSQKIIATNVQDAIDEVKKELIDDAEDLGKAILGHDADIQSLNTEMATKANSADVYSKTEADKALNNKLNKASDTAEDLTVNKSLSVNGDITINPNSSNGEGTVLYFNYGTNSASGVTIVAKKGSNSSEQPWGYLQMVEGLPKGTLFSHSGFTVIPRTQEQDENQNYSGTQGQILLEDAGIINLPYVAKGATDTFALESEITSLQTTVNQKDETIASLQSTIISQQESITTLQGTLTSLQNTIYGITLGSTAEEVKVQYQDVKQLLENISTNITYNNNHSEESVVGIYGTSVEGDKIAVWQEDVTDQGGAVTGTVINYGYTADSTTGSFTLYSIDTEGTVTVDDSVLSQTPKMYGAKLGGIIEG